MKLFLRKVIFTILFLLALFASSAAENDLLYNGDFELTDEEGIPDGWDTGEYFENRGYTHFEIIDDIQGRRGKVAFIENKNLNDARYIQYVDVEPDTVYRLSGYIRTESVINGRGANLSIEGLYAFSESVYGTNDWQYIEYYGETGPDQTYVGIYLRLGGYGGESIGKVWFDDVRLETADEIPEDVIAARWYAVSSYADDDSDDETEFGTKKQEPLLDAWLVLIIIGLLWIAVLTGVIYFYRDGYRLPGYLSLNPSLPCLPFILIALTLRLIISFLVEGYDVDVVCFTSWGKTMAFYGPTRFYQSAGMIDYPPLYTWILGINARIAADTNASAAGINVIYRFLPSLCDVLFCYGLYWYCCKKHPGYKHYSCIILIMTAFNPAMILNSAGWGQIDSVLSLMLVVVALTAIEKKWHIAIPVYALSVLVKPQALMLGFLGLAYIILAYIREPESRKSILKGFLIGVFMMIAGVIPFGLDQKFGWLIELYEKTLKSYPHATVNCANLYYLLGGNWDAIENNAHILAPVFMLVFSTSYAALWYAFNRKKMRYAWIESIIALLFSFWFGSMLLTPHSWGDVGTAAMAFPFLITISLAVRKGDIRFLPYLGGLLFILLYVFGVKMHERYLFPGLFLLITAWGVLRDRRILYISMLFTLTLFVNEGIILDNSIRMGRYYGHLMPDTVVIADIISIMNIIGAVLATLLAFSLLNGHRPGQVKIIPSVFSVTFRKTGRTPMEYHPDRKLYWNWKDTVILSVIVVIYSFISLMTLGSTKAPQTAWKSTGYDETIVFDLGDNHQDIRILYFGQVNYNDIAFAQSDDGINWSEDVYGEMNQGQCWKWKYVAQSYDYGYGRTFYNQNVLHFSCRYVRLTAQQTGLLLNEIIFRDKNGNTVPVKIISHEGADPATYSDPALLIDEQDTLEGLPCWFGEASDEAEPSWWNSTYFDEIYHARTGFEFVNASRPYETSHPPFGKIMISLSIRVFGMTPFGWRFAGALAGILMLPGMYLLGKQLTKRTSLSALICALMALDCMHLTQTQIATIDSYPVLFIIFAYFFMLRFMQTDIIRQKISKSVIPLCLSGLFMGFAIASKWIGIYAGAGLAILFFWHFFRTVRIARKSRELNASGCLKDDKSLQPFVTARYTCGGRVPVKLVNLCILCIVFFLIVPVVVYLISYIPYFAYDHHIKTLDDFLNAVWKAQVGMYDYHSTPGLGMDHPYYSPWYEWPVIGKPMWYANKQYLSADSSVSYSIFCFGNPVIWWGAFFTLFVCLIQWIRSKRYQISGMYQHWHLTGKTYDESIAFMLIGLMAQFFPWVPVPRGTYIYHYFASIPFLILSFGLCLKGLSEITPRTYTIPDSAPHIVKLSLRVREKIVACPRGRTIFIWCSVAVIVLLALISFIVFFPYASGIPVSVTWLDIGKKILHIFY